MAGWNPPDPLRYEARRPLRPANAQLLDAPEFIDGEEAAELDQLRRSYTNLSQECTELEEIVKHIRGSVAPFTDRDLDHLDRTVVHLRSALRAMRHAVKHERHWSVSGTLTGE